MQSRARVVQSTVARCWGSGGRGRGPGAGRQMDKLLYIKQHTLNYSSPAEQEVQVFLSPAGGTRAPG